MQTKQLFVIRLVCLKKNSISVIELLQVLNWARSEVVNSRFITKYFYLPSPGVLANELLKDLLTVVIMVFIFKNNNELYLNLTDSNRNII